MPGPDLEQDWAALGQPSRLQKAAAEVPKATMSFLDFLFTWLGRATTRFTGSFQYFLDEILWKILVYLGGLILVGALAAVLWQRSKAPGTMHHCYIEMVIIQHSDPIKREYKLVGERHWRSDVTIRQDEKFDVLVKTAEDIGCPIELCATSKPPSSTFATKGSTRRRVLKGGRSTASVSSGSRQSPSTASETSRP